MRYGVGFLPTHVSNIPIDFSANVSHGWRLAIARSSGEREIPGLAFTFRHPLSENVIDPVDDGRQRPEVPGEERVRSANEPLHQFDLPNVSTAEPIDRLLCIPHDEQLPSYGPDIAPVIRWDGRLRAAGHFLGQEHGKLRLKRIGVLYLVDENVRVEAPEVITRGDAVP